MPTAPERMTLSSAFDLCLAGTEQAVSKTLAGLQNALTTRGVGQDTTENALLVLGEVLNNIVEHAVSDLPDTTITVRVTPDPDRLLIETIDSGRPLPPRLLNQTSPPNIPSEIEDMPEGGFGWFIIHTLTDDMIYERQDGCNRLTFSLAA